MFINLCPHPVTIIKKDGAKLELPKCLTPARCNQTVVEVDETEGVGIYEFEMGEIYDLPEESAGIDYIVSRVVAEAANELGRKDIYFPGQAIRNDDGIIIGARGLSRIPR